MQMPYLQAQINNLINELRPSTSEVEARAGPGLPFVLSELEPRAAEAEAHFPLAVGAVPRRQPVRVEVGARPARKARRLDHAAQAGLQVAAAGPQPPEQLRPERAAQIQTSLPSL